MKQKNKKFKSSSKLEKRQQNLYYITLTISFVSITFLSALIIQGNRQESKFLLKGKMDQEILELVASYYQNNTEHYLKRNNEISGVIIYEKGVSTQYAYGLITKDPRIHSEEGIDPFEIDKKNHLILLNYELDIISRELIRSPIQNQVFSENNIVIHVETKANFFFRKIKNITYLQVIIHLFLLLLFIQMFLLFLRNNRLQQQLKSQKNLVILGSALRTLTHEMKNPLAAIRLQSGYIHKILPEQLEQETTVINNEVDRLSQLMDTVKDYLRDPVGKQEKIDLVTFMEGIKPLYSPQIQWQIPNIRYDVLFDKDKLRTVMDNLLNNAIESGSPTEGIQVEISRSKRLAHISIKDQGKGIPTEIKDRLFDPFFTTKSNGTGAGLMIVKRFIEASGGQIDITSRTGKTTEVLFRLPLMYSWKRKK